MSEGSGRGVYNDPWPTREPALMGGDPHAVVPSQRIGRETLPCAASVPK